MYVKDLMTKQSYILSEDDDIYLAAKFMKEEKIRSLPVVNKENKLVGLVTLREIVDALIKLSKNELVPAINKNSNDKLIINIMIKEVKAVTPDTPLKGAIEMMIVNKYNIVPVVDSHRKLLGVLTEQEVMKKLYELIELPGDFLAMGKVKETLKKIDNTLGH